jgi:dihydroxyacetone kinase-like predicted kinase
MTAPYWKEGTEYLVAKEEDATSWVLAVFAEDLAEEGTLVEVYEKDHATQDSAVADIQRLVKEFPNIEVTYLNAEGDTVDPWFRDWEYRGTD